jgi:hypothetical protein
MVSATTRTEAIHSRADFISNSSSSSSSGDSTKPFAAQLATALKGDIERSGSGSALSAKGSEVAGRTSAGSQYLVTVTSGTKGAGTGNGTAATETHTSTPITSAATATGTRTPSPTTIAPSDVPTMLGMGPVAGTAPVQQVNNPTPQTTAPVTEADAYWDAQPAAVQALRNMPDGPAKNQLALNLANQGYSIDTQIMVWGWDPQMTMTVRENQGYSWVPGYGQSNIPVGPGLSMPDNPNTYNPGNPPADSIQVSTAFAVGTVQNPLVQTNSSNS